MKTYCLTNEKHYWLLPAYLHLYRMFWSWQEVAVVGYGYPPMGLDGREFVSIAPGNYPAEQWSTGLIQFLESIEDEYLVLMLEDYWMSAQVQAGLIMLLSTIERGYFGPRFLRMDLSADRASQVYSMHETVAGFDIISTPSYSPYQMSFQAAVWHRRNLLSVLVPGETPWEAEVNGSQRLAGSDWLVLGTLQRPVKYTPVWRGHRRQLKLEGLPVDQVAYLERMGMVNAHV